MEGFEWRGCKGSIEVSHEDAIFHGKIQGIKSLIAYAGESYEELRTAFIEAANEYIDAMDDLALRGVVPMDWQGTDKPQEAQPTPSSVWKPIETASKKWPSRVLGWDGDDIEVIWWEDGDWVYGEADEHGYYPYFAPTHWMSLPPGPVGEKK